MNVVLGKITNKTANEGNTLFLMDQFGHYESISKGDSIITKLLDCNIFEVRKIRDIKNITEENPKISFEDENVYYPLSVFNFLGYDN